MSSAKGAPLTMVVGRRESEVVTDILLPPDQGILPFRLIELAIDDNIPSPNI
jgi:hypothetical protein